MSTTTTETRPTRATYGNWVAVRSPGLFGAGLAATAILLVGLVSAVLAVGIAGLPAGLSTAALTLAGFAATATGTGARLVRRIAWALHHRSGQNVFVSGVESPNAEPDNRLPGMLSRTRLLEHHDPAGAPFAVVHDPRKGGLFTIVAVCHAEGPAMCDPSEVDDRVAAWARLLAAAGAEPGVVCVKAIADTAPEPPGRLAAAIDRARCPNSPALARAVMAECAAAYPAIASRNVCYLEVTFTADKLSPATTDAAARTGTVLGELARRVPGLLAGLAEAGGGSVAMLEAGELCDLVRAAYDPTATRAPDRATGNHAEGLAAAWPDAGPGEAVESWDTYRHQSATSISWQMETGPKAPIGALAFAALLGPHPDLDRKRVALIHRPHTPDSSARIAETDATAAGFAAGNDGRRRRPAAAELLRVRATEASRHEVAHGAVLTRMSILVTATVTDPARLSAAAAAVQAAAGCVPIRLARCTGAQAAAFATTLPVGFVPWEHTFITDKIRGLL